MSWTQSTIGEVLSVIRNGVNCEQSKIPVGERITRIETIATQSFDFNRVGFSELTESQKEKNKIQKGDILFSHINSPIHVGKTAIYESDEDLYHGINLLLLRTNDSVNPHFFNYFLNYLFVTGYWENNCKKAVNQASVNQQDINKIRFCYPSLEIQQKLVNKFKAIFSDIDKAITGAKESILNAEFLFQIYLTDVFELGGEGWTDTTIEDVTIKTKNVNPLKSPNLEFQYVDVSSVSNTEFFITSTQKLLGADAPSRAKKNILTNDIIFATVRPTLKRIAIVPKELNNQVASTGYVVLRAKENIYYKYIFFFLFSYNFIQSMEKLQRGASYPAVTDSDVKSQRIKVPSYNEQIRIAEKLESLMLLVSNFKKTHTAKISELINLRNSILQHTFNKELIEK
ncbi:restriction endonuclease subunit S [Polynucleobacter sp. TSB-Sco08W16]|uniref:restriction endonuclease subunit S n=1 Tax=Polynucleobacter sp. TSB-Sco08W16 TaxID=1758374 RepID=UPI001BFD6A1C|nr:restriction endonuclease subunit S [Polynucleobacter sp. TSB-Sco08W16]QWD74743.1 restriction endonuclease subunit S [Polynucleobacter sp. TSB-Sco08W16]